MRTPAPRCAWAVAFSTAPTHTPAGRARATGSFAPMSTPDTTDQDLLGLRPLKEITLGERVIDTDLIPWVPYTERSTSNRCG